MKIPFVDLKVQYLSIKEDIDMAIQNVINETAFIKGKNLLGWDAKFSLSQYIWAKKNINSWEEVLTTRW